MNPSGTGRFIADSWYSDEPLPAAYTHPAAARLRQSGGIAAREPDAGAIEAYLAAVDVAAAIEEVTAAGRAMGGVRGAFLGGLAECLRVMWDLVQGCAARDRGSRTSAACAHRPGRRRRRRGPRGSGRWWPNSSPGPVTTPGRRRSSATPSATGATSGSCLARRSGSWRPRSSPCSRRARGGTWCPACRRSCARYRANIQFLPIEDAWFSGSMNDVGRARRRDGSPEYEAT
jgi:hypothetical protein